MDFVMRSEACETQTADLDFSAAFAPKMVGKGLKEKPGRFDGDE